MTERTCVRGCVQRDVHYATCEHSGPTYTGEFPCRGCAPRECRDGSLICDRCFGRMRHLLAETPDLIGRLRSLADPLKATPTDNVRTGGAPVFGPREPNPVDLLDAIEAVHATYATFESWGTDLTRMSNDVEAISWMCTMVLDRHRPEDGVREAWSIQDAIDQWGVERRDPREVDWEDDEDGEEIVGNVGEWQEQLLTREEVAKRAGISLSTMRRLEAKGHVTRRAVTHSGRKRTAWFYLSQVREGVQAAEAARAAEKEKTP